jgi:glutamate--cysteine ligase
LDQLAAICDLLDGDEPGGSYALSLAEQRETLADPERTPSARILTEMRASGENFFRCTRRLSEQHRAYFQAVPLASERRLFFTEAAAQSWQKQRVIEAADTLPFDEFLNRYFLADRQL